MLSASGPVVFLLDVDNTLLDNDRFSADLSAHLERDFGSAQRDRYLSIYNRRRNELGYADYLGSLQEFRDALDNAPHMLGMSDYLLEYPFRERLYPRALEVIAHLRTLGMVAVFSDGDIVFQPRKVRRSGILDAVQGEVLICLHKERQLTQMRDRYPGRHYVMVDDKPLLLAAMKRALGGELTTVFVRQGHYAAEAAGKTIEPPPDLTIDCIGDLTTRGMEFFLVESRKAS